MFVLWIMMMGLTTYLILSNKFSPKLQWIFYIVTLIIGGIILGAIPSPIMPIQIILAEIGLGTFSLLILPTLVGLFFFLSTFLLIGRMFCGYACPVGVIQEIVSKVNFKNDLKNQKKARYKIDIPQKYAKIIRWFFFVFIITSSIVWNLALLQFITPFAGIYNLRYPSGVLISVPLITIIIVIVLSVFIYRPWCRMLCPFGALASVISRFSKYKYIRSYNCSDCGLCERICPTNEAKIDSSKSECYFCQRCVDVCPKDAIKLRKS